MSELCIRMQTLETVLKDGLVPIMPHLRQIPTAAECLEYFMANAVGGTPRCGVPDKFSINTGSPLAPSKYQNPEFPLWIIPFTSADASLGPYWKSVHAKPGLLLYQPNTHAILFNIDIQATVREKAMGLMHEAGHALRADSRGHVCTDHRISDQEWLEEEVTMHWMEHTIAQAIDTSGAYAAAIAEAVAILRKPLARKVEIFSLPDSSVATEAIFGPLLPNGSQQARAAIFTINAHLAALAAIFTTTALEKQTAFMDLVYRRIGFHRGE